MPPKDELVSAQVIVPSAKDVDANVPITSENVRDFAPDPNKVVQARQVFQEAGFEVSELVGIGFSITASLTTFENFFGMSLEQNEDAGVRALTGEGASYELPLSTLPEQLTSLISAVSFSPPPDFGPKNFMEP